MKSIQLIQSIAMSLVPYKMANLSINIQKIVRLASILQIPYNINPIIILHIINLLNLNNKYLGFQIILLNGLSHGEQSRP